MKTKTKLKQEKEKRLKTKNTQNQKKIETKMLQLYYDMPVMWTEH